MLIVKKLKDKRCKNKACGKIFTPSNPLQTMCGYDCAVHVAKEKLAKKIEKERKEELRKWNIHYREEKDKIKDLSDFKADLQDEINTIIRLIDKGHPCISSGAKRYTVHAGHYYSVGANQTLRFNLMNIYAQSLQDNNFKSGNGIIYRERIAEVFGNEHLEEIEGLKAKYPILDLTIPEVRATIKIARRIVRRLKKQTEDFEQPFTTEERITLRRALNEEIGLYE